jgi:hypothetical protein
MYAFSSLCYREREREVTVTFSTKTSVASRIVALVVLLSVAAMIESASLSALHDEQIWGQLRAGTWILENKTWPHTGLFSQAANLPWRDFNWAYDVMAALLFRAFNLSAIPALLTSFRFALAALTFALAGGLKTNFWSALTLSAVAQYVLGTMGPGPTSASVVFFGIELLLLLEICRTANLRTLYALAILFLLWANVDIGFVYGIGLYVLFLVGLSLEQTKWFAAHDAQIPINRAWLTGSACVLASMVNPYGYRSYVAFFAEQSSAANEYLTPYKAMSFHRPQDYVLLLLAMIGFLALGLRRSRSPFLLAALVAGAFMAFHAQREGWIVVLVSIVVIGVSIPASDTEPADPMHRNWKWQIVAPGLAVAFVFLALLRMPSSREQLLAKVAENYPVAASDYIRENHLPHPLFNSYGWGSFLTWYLPEYPVAMDVRRGLYPEEEETSYFKVMNIDVPYQSFEPMTRSRTLLMDKSDVLAEALRDTSGFQVAYEDHLAIVLLQEQKE